MASKRSNSVVINEIVWFDEKELGHLPNEDKQKSVETLDNS